MKTGYPNVSLLNYMMEVLKEAQSFFKAISKYDFSYFNREFAFINNTLKL
jgi:hypothetical protein